MPITLGQRVGLYLLLTSDSGLSRYIGTPADGPSAYNDIRAYAVANLRLNGADMDNDLQGPINNLYNMYPPPNASQIRKYLVPGYGTGGPCPKGADEVKILGAI